MDQERDLSDQDMGVKIPQRPCPSKPPKVKCEISDKQEPQTPSDTSSNSDLPLFKCSECSYQSIWKHSVKRHQPIHFKDESSFESVKTNTFQCGHCSSTLESWGDFKEHQTIHITSNKTPMDRDKGEKFNVRKRRKGQSSNECESLYESRYKKHLENLEKTHNSINKLESFECDYTSQEEFIRFLMDEKEEDKNMSTGINPKRPYKRGKYAHIPVKTTENGLFQCQHCSYQTAIRSALLKHQTNHVTN